MRFHINVIIMRNNTFQVIHSPKLLWALEIGHGPTCMSHSNTRKNKNLEFDEPFLNFDRPFGNFDGPKNH